MEVASRMIFELCGGKANTLTVAGELPDVKEPITLRLDRLKNFGGIEIDLDRAASILRDLGFAVEAGSNVLEATPPSWRPDVEGEHCLVEEVLRVFGYDKIPTVPMERESELPKPILTPSSASCGFCQTRVGRSWHDGNSDLVLYLIELCTFVWRR